MDAPLYFRRLEKCSEREARSGGLFHVEVELKHLCTYCRKREACTRLCIEAETYASQDYVAEDHRLSIISPDLYTFLLDRPGDRNQDRLKPTGGFYGEVVNAAELGDAEWDIVESCERMTVRQKECLYLHYWIGLSQEGVSLLLGIRKSVVNTHLKKGEEILGDKLKPSPPDEAEVKRFKSRMRTMMECRLSSLSSVRRRRLYWKAGVGLSGESGWDADSSFKIG